MRRGTVASDAANVEVDDATWLSNFKKRHGRAPRILHIGNIANNAYNNAKLLIDAGFECDVICYDYYHIMGCPEWEDADFDGDVGDQFHPKWTKVNLNGFQRPRWFAQGPVNLCIEYLMARRIGKRRVAAEKWKMLAALNATGTAREGGSWNVKVMKWQVSLFRYAGRLLAEDSVERRLRQYQYAISWRIRAAVRVVKGCGDGLMAVKWLRYPLHIARRTGLTRTMVAIRRPGTRLDHRLVEIMGSMIEKGVGVGFRVAIRAHARVARGARWAFRRLIARQLKGGYSVECGLFERVAGLYRKALPGRADPLVPDDLFHATFSLPLWKNLFEHYEIILAYSTDPILPMLAGRRYFALEHGTLREIPFKQDRQGRLTALAYHFAEHAFVTNYDCLGNAKMLCGDRVTFINHPYDEDHGLKVPGVEILREELKQELESDFVIFFPSRHDWVEGSGYADKANDRLLRALGKLRKQGRRIGAVCCRWGQNVRESKELLAELGMSGFVRWVEPMGIVRFEKMCRACDVVADQFKLGAFGGVTFKAMAVGVPVCTYVEPELLRGLFPELPPVINCRTEQEIFEALALHMDDPILNRQTGAAARAWIETYHSGRAVVAAQLKQFRRYLEEIENGGSHACA